jgi:hypothetical protein
MPAKVWYAMIGFFVMGAVASGNPMPVTDDLWDVSRGTTVTSSALYPGFDARDAFGGCNSSEPCVTIFSDGLPQGSVHTLLWTTVQPVTILGFNLFVSGDEPIDPNNPLRRSIDHVTVWAGGNIIYDADVTDPPGAWVALVVHLSSPVTAQQFRADFRQAATQLPPLGVNDYTGPRVIELDATIPEPATITLIGLGICALICGFRRRAK